MRRSCARTKLLCAVVVMLLAFARVASSQDAGASSASTASDASASAVAADPRTAQVRALVAGSLDVSVAPQSLFDVPLEDEAALQIEAARVRALLRAVDAAARPPEPVARSRTRRAPAAAPDAGSLRADLAALDAERWQERVDLDRARLAFYELSPEQRAELLRAHAARQQAAQPQESPQERRAREAEAERARALEAARLARSEAERMVSEELARLIALEARVRNVRERFQRERDDIALRRDAILGWQRRIREAKSAGSAQADSTYDALRRALRASRDDLARAMAALNDERSEVPELGADPLNEIPPDIPTDAARERRTAVERAIADARRAEHILREQRAAALLDEINALNRERLGMLPRLSPDKRAAITGFTAAGWDQARSEARQLSLILRYHQHVALTWVRSLRRGASGVVSPWKTTAVLVPLILVSAAFLWARRRTQAALRWAEVRLAVVDRAERRTSPSFARRVVRILLKTHGSMEWILFSMCVLWLLPSGAQDLLEVQLLASVVWWSLAGALIVNVINALAAGDAATLTLLVEEGEAGRLRLRSLRLVGRTVVGFTLVLVLSARLVGQGTIYSWVFSTCWFAAIPVFLLLVRWWRGTVFERLDRLRKKTPLQTWILANRSGWKSFAAAMSGAVQLFASGTLKVVRSWLSDFDLARRVHAYLFKREIERIGEEHAHARLVPLSVELLDELHPERAQRTWLACPSDEIRDAIVQRAASLRGGLIVVIGAKGMGKSALFRELAAQLPGAVCVACQAQTSPSEFREAARVRDDRASSSPRGSIMLVDDAHTLVEPRIGGLAKFDEIIAFARARSEHTPWVFAVDASMWPLLKRARDARPIFDVTYELASWDEMQIGALIAERSQAAGIDLSYDDLLDKLPRGADELDRQDALNATRVGYERMLWDHVGGNPGLAMEVWRVSLGQDAAGLVHVRPLQVPDIAALERLPDSSLFVLRAVLQLAPTTADKVAAATRLRPEEVLQEFRFGKAQGFYDDHAGRVCVAWPWLRAATRLLERRHLLVTL